MRKDIIVLGAGWIGKKIAEGLNCRLYENWINDEEDIARILKDNDAKIVINAIGQSGETNISWCDRNKSKTYFSNVHIPYLLKDVCKIGDIKLVHLSSCYVEYDNSFYSQTKKMAEDILLDYDNVLICRINLPIDSKSHPRNLIDKLLGYEKITGLKSSMTVLDDFIHFLKLEIEKDTTGILNFVNEGTISPWEIIEMYENYTAKDLNKIFLEDNREFKVKQDVYMPPIKKSVKQQIKKYLKINK